MILRIFGYLFGIGAVFFLLIAGAIAWYVSGLAEDLPDYDVLAKYEPPVMTRIHAADGQLVAEYAHERRLYLPIQAIPDRVKAAFLSAEDKNFYHHAGLDYYGIARAMIQNVQAYGSGRRLVGASTITQQVAKNFLLTNEQTVDRKIKEAILVAPHRAGLLQGQDPRALPQRDLPRPRRLRRRRGGARLFRQVGARADARRGRLSRRAAQGAEQLQPVPLPGPRASSAATG